MSIGLYGPILIDRVVTVLMNWPVSGLTLATGGLEFILLNAALGLLMRNNLHRTATPS